MDCRRGLASTGWLTAAIALAALSFASPAKAYPAYGADIPNGRYTYGAVASESNTRCWICHLSTYGGYGGAGSYLNSFGLDFQANSYSWNSYLASLDSDDDGWTNGQELRNEWGDSTARDSTYYSLPGNPPGLSCSDIPNAGAFATLRSRCNTDFSATTTSGRMYSSRFEFFESYYNTCSSGNNDCESVASCSRSSGNGRGDWDCTCGISYTGDGHDRTRYHDWDAPNSTLGDDRLFQLLSAGSRTGCVSKCSPNPCGVGSCSHSGGGNGYVCNCPSGYEDNGSTCVIDYECTDDPARCGNGSCIEQPPPNTYACDCDDGYVDNGTTCVVSNPCVAGTDDCDRNASCAPVGFIPGYRCTCDEGFVGTGSVFGGTGDMCADVDECATRDICGPGTCMNRTGSYTCRCNSGYRFDGTTCVDVNECSTSPCGVGGVACNNSPGSYSCDCAPGYMFDGTTCVDIDECAIDPCGAGVCEEIDPPGYTCACEGGYEFDSTTCVDVDECATGVAGCDEMATCANRVGSFECTCVEGWEGDGTTCTDVDECASADLNECDTFAVCINQVGAYDCECTAGYEGSGLTCTRIDPCASGEVSCGSNEFCTTTGEGVGYCECEPGFARAAEGEPCESACGDGERTPGEECDDGNGEDVDDEGNPDGCSSTCDIQPGFACWEPDGSLSVCENTCGNGFIDRDAGETCDLGPDGDYDDETPDACRSNCRLGYCGDGVVDTGEECDAGDMVSDERANACRETGCREAYCGDGVVDSGEECDRGEPGGDERDDCNACAPPDMGVTSGPDMGDDSGDMSGDDGCGCATPGSGRSRLPLGGLLLFAFALWRRRR
jgi:MYXO-CTERM domain-containing protein